MTTTSDEAASFSPLENEAPLRWWHGLRRWIEGQAVDDVPLLDAPEIGPVADAAVLYESVHNMQVVPIGKRTLVTILLPMTLPFLVLPLLKYPLATIMSALLKALL